QIGGPNPETGLQLAKAAQSHRALMTAQRGAIAARNACVEHSDPRARPRLGQVVEIAPLANLEAHRLARPTQSIEAATGVGRDRAFDQARQRHPKALFSETKCGTDPQNLRRGHLARVAIGEEVYHQLARGEVARYITRICKCCHSLLYTNP